MTGRSLVILPLLFLGGLQDPETVPVLTRDVRLRILDPVGRLSEIERQERVWISERALRIEDLTFKRDLLISRDLGSLVLIDRAAKTHREIPFSKIMELRSSYLKQIDQWKARVQGTEEEEALARLARGLHWGGGRPASAEIGRKEELLGRSCVETQVLSGGDYQICRVWVDPSISGYFELFSAASALPVEFPVKGAPLKGVVRYTLLLDRVQSQATVTRIEERAPPDEIFRIPADSDPLKEGSGAPPEIPEKYRR